MALKETNKMEYQLCDAIKCSCIETPNVEKRVFTLGNRKNCNGEVMKNTSIKDNIENIMKKYNIDDYKINIIDNNYEFAYELIIDNNNCNKIYQKLIS